MKISKVMQFHKKLTLICQKTLICQNSWELQLSKQILNQLGSTSTNKFGLHGPYTAYNVSVCCLLCTTNPTLHSSVADPDLRSEAFFPLDPGFGYGIDFFRIPDPAPSLWNLLHNLQNPCYVASLWNYATLKTYSWNCYQQEKVPVHVCFATPLFT
jgi:hypothetical protein